MSNDLLQIPDPEININIDDIKNYHFISQLDGSNSINKNINFHIKNPDINSNIRFKFVVFDEAIINLNIIIKLYKGAKNSNIYLKVEVLNLSTFGQINIVPSLEIKENEVKASHGLTIADLDETQLNYLMSKGLSENISKKLLIKSFLKA